MLWTFCPQSGAFELILAGLVVWPLCGPPCVPFLLVTLKDLSGPSSNS